MTTKFIPDLVRLCTNCAMPMCNCSAKKETFQQARERYALQGASAVRYMDEIYPCTAETSALRRMRDNANR